MSPRAFTKDERERLQLGLSYLLNHLHQQVTVTQLARCAAMGEQRFKDGFQLLFGHTPGAYLHKARLHTSLVLLKHTDKTIKEIASLCGYAHYKNFLTAFKRFFGHTPNQIRK